MNVLYSARVPRISQRHADARRRQILTAARICFTRDGLTRTTMQDIFRESGLSPGAVYTYFYGKDEIVREVAEEALQGEPDPRLAVQLWAEALHDARIMQLVRRTEPGLRAQLLEAALRPW